MRKTVIVMSLLAVVIGLMMIFAPEAVVKTTVILLGISGIANGVYNIVYLRKADDDKNFRLVILIRGMLGIITGTIAVLLPIALAGTVWTAMVYMISLYLLASAVLEIYGTIKLRLAGINTKIYVAEIIGSIILAAILFALSAKIGLVLIRIIGTAACIMGLGTIFWEHKTRATVIYAEKIDD